MKVSREQAAANRERIVETAARLFREKGFDGIGVADLMKSAGMTHGGFYGHFASKDSLAAEACARAMETSLLEWEKRVAAASEKAASEKPGAEKTAAAALEALVMSYLSTAHRDNPGKGCVLPALASEAGRQGGAVRRAVTIGTKSMIDRLASLLPGRSAAATRGKAMVAIAGMVGAIVLARAVEDEELSADILRSMARSITVPHNKREAR
ncbi:TetR/AcrR family transcriptional regulator [Dongia soli]|uniref:Helix-turn-helix domain-containing protein n=1 Tax=Dongia soli TaxID=600628 RepID=A0ABU5EFB4_9PROT|nr:helix-turn-helix domain-containing protein [Dongia soli]MDY0884790.1 helix-turn-helix domain-containing protein [Dongia soli]